MNLDIQTVLIDEENKSQTRLNILKGETEPSMKLELLNGKGFVASEVDEEINTFASYTTTYDLNGTISSTINTDVVGEYKVSKQIDVNSITIPNFTSKYNINSQASATLIINDTNFTDEELYTITGDHVNDEWYTNIVSITPIHADFSNMSIDGGTATTGTQTYPKNADVDVDTTIRLSFANSRGSSVTKYGIPIKIDSIKPTFTILTKSNNQTYVSGSSTMYDVNVEFVKTNTNISGEEYFYTKDVDSNGNIKANATWISCGDFSIHEGGTYYMKAVSGAGLQSNPIKFVANIERPDITQKPSVTITSNNKAYVADGTVWAKNDVTFKLSGNTAGYEVCTSVDNDRNTDCADTSTNWKTINTAIESIHRITQDQSATIYWFRNKIAGFQTVPTNGYTIMLDNVLPDTPSITVSEKQKGVFSMFDRNTNAYYNKEVVVEIASSDDDSGIASVLYDVYDKDDKLLKEEQSYTGILSYKDINISIRAKAIDHAGNVSVESDLIAVRVDSIAPQISGIKNDASYYVPYVFISFEDSGSGIDSAYTTYTNNNTTAELGNNTLFNGKGNVTVNVQDLAGNATSLSFEILGLPEKMDCSKESFELIDKVKAQYNDVKGYLNETQKKEIIDWMARASNSCSVTDPEHNVTVENPEAKIPENTVLVVDVITTTIDDVQVPLENNEEIKIAYDVYFKKEETLFKDLEGSEMRVKLPLGAYKGAKGFRVISIEEDGTTKDLEYDVEGDYVVFVTNELKKYAFIAEKSDDPNINVDIDCDGKADINIDVDGDGKPDINIDTTGDGKPNYNIDIDNDQKPDVNLGPIDWKVDLCKTTTCGTSYCTSTYYKPYLNIDTDNDLRPDINIDLDKDMEADINIDTDFNNIPNVDIDRNGDGKPDCNVDENGDGKADKNLATIAKWIPNKNVDTPILYDTMADITLDSSEEEPPKGDDGNGDENQDPPTNITPTPSLPNGGGNETTSPTVKGDYLQNGVGGANTGIANNISYLVLLSLTSCGIIVWILKKQTSRN